MGRIEGEARRLRLEAEWVDRERAAAAAKAARQAEQAQQERDREEALRQADEARAATAATASIIAAAQIYPLLEEMQRKHWRCGSIESHSHGRYGESVTKVRLHYSYPGWSSERGSGENYDVSPSRFVDEIKFTIRLRSNGRREIEAESTIGGYNYLHGARVRLSQPRMEFSGTTPPASLMAFVVRALAEDLNVRRSGSQAMMPRDLERLARKRGKKVQFD